MSRAMFGAAFFLTAAAAPAVDEGFTPLFDGKTLAGWTIHCLPKDKEFAAKAWDRGAGGAGGQYDGPACPGSVASLMR